MEGAELGRYPVCTREGQFALPEQGPRGAKLPFRQRPQFSALWIGPLQVSRGLQVEELLWQR